MRSTIEDQIADATKMRFRALQYASMNNPRYGIMHISDLVEKCKRKAIYSKMAMIEPLPLSTGSLGILYGGEAVHKMNDNTSKENPNLCTTGELPFVYDFVKEEEVNLGEFRLKMKSDNPYTVEECLDFVFGETDGLYKDLRIHTETDVLEEDTFIDYKTWDSTDKKLLGMKEAHYLQLSAYAAILNKLGKTETEYVSLIYLDTADRYAKPIVFTKKAMRYDKVRALLIADRSVYLDFLETGVLPKRYVSPLCDGYCDHIKRCSDEEWITKEENRKLRIAC